MNYLEIFDEIVSIVHTDYSGCIDKRGWDNPELSRKKIMELEKEGKLDSYIFKEIVDDYLLDFKDGHMFFNLVSNDAQKIYDNGFECRRYGDKLYITHVGMETKLKKGMAIIELDGVLINELGEKYRRMVQIRGSHPERERWEPVILKCSKCKVEDKVGNIFEMPLRKYEREKYIPEYSLKKLDSGILLMILTDFNDDDAINKLIEDNKDLLETSKNLVIDVRHNRGGSDSAFFKLLEYIFTGDVDLNKLDEGAMQINMTERNYKLRVDSFKEQLNLINDPFTKNFLNVFIREMDKHRNEGLVEVDLSDAIPELLIKGRKNPENIVVLGDVYCGSSGDAFVENVKKSDKVTIMGRGTAGITDYSNLAIQEWDNTFQLLYPTSRNSAIDEGKGLTGVGVVPEIYIPWTPEHIERDIDMERAVEFLLNK